MLEYEEVNPLPDVCIQCMAGGNENEDCYNCDYTLERWHLKPESEDRLPQLWREYKENKMR